MKRVNLIYNPKSGQVWRNFKPEIVKEYLENKGLIVDISSTSCPNDATRLARLASQNNYDVVIAAGGDGTINEVVQGLAGTKTILAILPVGTTNVLARELNIPLNFEKALEIIPNGEVISIDLGIINNRYFVLMAGIGFDAKLVKEVDSNLKKYTGILAFAATSPYSMFRHKKSKMIINIWDNNGKRKKIKINSYQVLITNAPTYAIGLKVSHTAKYNDGLLDLDIFTSERIFDFAWKLISIAFITKKASTDIRKSYQFKKMTIKTESSNANTS
ncbi:MAG: hypothetical protein KatS3mg068_2258 [Candidatus Sericytochromatia bacterium]|nr:MAG: hypothetical protein KatS3mg068_2258 [Candidatus Sericytochromatia bacterium]